MARHEIVIHENTGATRTAAPYLGSYISKETVVLDAFAEAIGEKCGLPKIQVIAIISGAFQAISALESEALVRVHTDIGVVCGVITGSFPTADAAFDPARNALELALRLDDTLRLDLADTVPVIITDADLTKLRVDNVMDLEVERPMNLIHGQHVFRVAGFNMVLGDEGAAAYLENGIGTTFPLVIDHVTSHQLFTAHTAELLPAGDYKLVVKSRAGDAAGPLQTSFRKVKYLRVEDPPGPTLGAVWSEGQESPTIEWYKDIQMTGANLALGADGKVDAQLADTEEPDTWYGVTAYVDREASGADRIVLQGARGGEEEDEGVWDVLGPDVQIDREHSQVRFRVMTADGSAAIVADTLVP